MKASKIQSWPAQCGPATTKGLIMLQTFTVTAKWLTVSRKGAKLGHVVGATFTMQKQYESHEALAFLSGVGSVWCVPGVGRYQIVAI